MKNVYLFVALLAMSHGVFAKGEFQPIVTAGPIVNGKFPHFSNQVVNTTGGTGGGTTPVKVSLRLIGRTYAKFSAGSFVPVDSYSYRYTNDRGGILANDNVDNDETLYYDESVYYKYDATFVNYEKQLQRTQSYWPDGNVKFFTYQPWNETSGKFKDSARYGYEYVNGKMEKSTFQLNYANMWTNDMTSTISYLPNVTSMESDFYRAKFVYDVNARLIETIDSQNINGVWQNNEKHTYEYSGNSVTKHSLYVWDNNSWVNTKNWQYGYNNDKDLISKIEEEFTNAGWVVVKHEYVYDGNRNMTTDLVKKWNGTAFVDASKEVWTYNIQNLPELIISSTWNGSSWIYTDNDQQYRLYYENYFPAEVEKVASGQELNIYPVPAADIVNVNMLLRSSEDVSVALYDVKGATVYGSIHNAVSELQAKIPVSNLPAGTYFLRLTGSNTNVARSIVVQH